MPQILNFDLVEVYNPADGRRKLGCSNFAEDLAAITSDDIKEGSTHLFWTQARFTAALAKAKLPGLPGPPGPPGPPGTFDPSQFAALFALALSGLVTVIDGNGDSDADTLDFNSDDYTTVLDCNGL